MSSPRSARKRTNDEIYTNRSGKGTGHSTNLPIDQRPRTAPEQSQKVLQSSHFEQRGFLKAAPKPAAQSFGSTITTLNTQPSDASTALTTPYPSQTFVAQLQELQARFDREFDQFEQELEQRDHKAQFEPYDWDGLEGRYLEEIEPAITNEQEIQMNVAKRYRHMLLWMQTSSDREAQRAIKRLRTRIAFVQTSEEKLAQKEQHYGKVLKAFQSTMALLGGS